jgi:glutamate-1-semialdehyde 2,1-aminomutase
MSDATAADLADLLTPRHEGIDLARLHQLVEKERERYVERTPRSQELADRAGKHLIGGVMSSWHADWHLPHPLYVERSKDNRVWDVDGNEYVDFNLGDTPDMFGHAPDNAVTRSVADFVRRSGSATLLPSEDAIVASEILADRIGLPYWYTALSASDANRFAIKIARMLTGRPRILMFNLAYHGTVDETLHWTLEPGVIQRRFHVDYAPGQDPAATTKIANWNDLESVERALADGDVALVLAEPALTNTGIVLPEPGFHAGLRALCSRYGAYLLIDETHTLSEGPRGCTGEWGLVPDIWVAGKAIASGIPCAVYGMSAEIGEGLAAVLASDDPQGVGGMTGLGTTVGGNALSTHALRMTLEHVLTEEVYAGMRAAMRRLVQGMRDVIAKRAVAFSVTAMGNRCDLRFLPQPARDAFDGALGLGVGGYFDFVHLRALNEGFLIIPYYNMFLCSPYTSARDVDAWIACFDDLVADMLGNG